MIKNKLIATRPMKGPGTDPVASAMVGGVTNKYPSNRNVKKSGRTGNITGAPTKSMVSRK